MMRGAPQREQLLIGEVHSRRMGMRHDNEIDEGIGHLVDRAL
ncbi:MAG: hypothetical protein WBV82_14740 [Myxococcaceae bacterium]